MEIKVQVLRVELASSREGGRYDLHCKVETQSDEFVNSSVVELVAEGRRPVSTSTVESTSSPQWPTFTYNFRAHHTEAALLFKLSSLDSPLESDGPLEVAKGVVLYQYQSSAPTRDRVVILGSVVEGLVAMKYEGKVLFQINCSYSSPTEPVPLHPQWSEMKTPRNHLPLLYSHPLLDVYRSTSDEASSPNEEELQEPEEDLWAARLKPNLDITVQEAMLQEQQDSAPINTHFPGDASTVSVVFHAINLPTKALGSQLNLQPVACFTVNQELLTSGGPSCNWGKGSLGVHHSSFSYTSIMKSVSLTPDEGQSTIGLYLFSTDMEGPLLTAYEDANALVPFCFHHRIWPYGVETPVSSIDKFLQSSLHVISSVCLTPSQADYIRYEGLEVAVTRVSLQTGACKETVVGAQIVSNQLQVLQGPLLSPPFIDIGKVQNSNNYKFALLRSSSEHTATTRRNYFLFTGRSVDFQSLQEADQSLSLQFFTLDPTSPAPWWKSHSYHSAQLPLNQATFSALLSEDAGRGALWQLEFKQPDLQVDLILRWKMKQMQFMTDLEDSRIRHLPLLEDLLHETSPSSPAAFLQTSIHHEAEDRQDKLEQLQSTMLQRGQDLDPPMPPQPVPDSQGLLSQYKAALQELNYELTRLREANIKAQQENHSLLQQLTEISTNQAKTAAADSCPRRQLEAMPKVDLVNMIEQLQAKLDHETAQKVVNQQKVHSLQNVLIQKNDMERKLISLQEAHTGQQKLIHELQRKVKKYRKCYDTCLQQDAIITRLEEALATNRQKEPPKSQLETNYSRPDLDQLVEGDSHSEDDKETVRVLELRLVNALQRITQLEGALQASTAGFPHRYPGVHQITAVEQSAASELQLQHELLEAEAKMSKLKQENKQLRTSLTLTKEVLEQNKARPHQASTNRQPSASPFPTRDNIRQIQANATSF